MSNYQLQLNSQPVVVRYPDRRENGKHVSPKQQAENFRAEVKAARLVRR